MKIRLIIKTPKGEAKRTAGFIGPWLVGKSNHHIWINEEDNEMAWEIEGRPADVTRISKNVAGYDIIIKSIFQNKLFRGWFNKHFPEKDQKELEDMLRNHTKIDIIKTATAEELLEDNKTFWQKIKEKFKPHHE